jgi:hypothetical protein
LGVTIKLIVTTIQKEERIREIGKPWADLLPGLQLHRRMKPEEEKSPHADGIRRARSDYYDAALDVILKCAAKSK